jgi:hypothetical protein
VSAWPPRGGDPSPGHGSEPCPRQTKALETHPAMAWWPDKIKGGERNHDIIGGLDLMATFAAVAGVKLPTEDR